MEDFKEGREEYDVKATEEIKSDKEDILNRARENEHMVKKKVKEVLKQEDIKKYSCIEENRGSKDEVKKKKLQPTEGKAENFPIQIENMTKFIKTKQENENLSANISEYCEDGPFLTHLPEFRNLVKFIIDQYEKKLPAYG